MRWAIWSASFCCRDNASICQSASRRFLNGVDFAAHDRRHGLRQQRRIADLNQRAAKIVISQHPRRTIPLQIDTEIYKWRHLIENFFGRIKEFKRIAMRADKTDQSFTAMIYLTAAVVNSR